MLRAFFSSLCPLHGTISRRLCLAQSFNGVGNLCLEASVRSFDLFDASIGCL